MTIDTIVDMTASIVNKICLMMMKVVVVVAVVMMILIIRQKGRFSLLYLFSE